MFRIFEGEDNPFVATVHIDRYFRLAENFPQNDEDRADGVRTLVTLRNGDSSGFRTQIWGRESNHLPDLCGYANWNDWSTNPSFVIFLLEMQKYIAKRFERDTSRDVGVPIEVAVSPSAFSEEIEIVSPDERISRIKMTPQNDRRFH